MFTYGDIRAFTTSEIARMNAELSRISNVISQKDSDLSGLKWNPLNYVIETQRDALKRMELGLAQDRKILDQLTNSQDEVIESGDTDRLQRWFDLSQTIGSSSDLAIWKEQAGFASTTQMVSTVGAETTQQVKNPFGIDWKIWVGGAVVLYIVAAGLGRRR